MARVLTTFAAAGIMSIMAGCADLPKEPKWRSADRMIAAEGAEIHVRSWGQGAPDAPPVLLIHSAASDIGQWNPALGFGWEHKFRLTAYDRPGFGLSRGLPARSGSLAVQAEVAADVIRSEGLKSPVVIAHSYGGSVALRLALDHPELIAGLVLISPPAYEWPGDVAWHYSISSNPLLGPAFNTLVVGAIGGAAARSGLANSFSPRTPPPDYFELAGVARATSPSALAANARDLVALRRELIAQSPRYRGIAVPVAIFRAIATASFRSSCTPGVSRASCRFAALSRSRMPVIWRMSRSQIGWSIW